MTQGAAQDVANTAGARPSTPLGERLAHCALQVVATPWPYHHVLLLKSPADLQPPAALHPVFGGAYDWHSSVHMHWSLLRLLRLGRAGVHTAAVERWFEARFTAAALDAELAFFARSPTFERPYGWAWFWMLAAEAKAWQREMRPQAEWPDRLRPLATLLGERAERAWAAAGQPQRAGFHANSAFALCLARHAAPRLGLDGLASAVDDAARRWFGADRAWPAHYEPGWNDFLSPGLVEAALMSSVLAPDEGLRWWRGFRPRRLERWRTPATGFDRRDAHAVHLDGLNLSRAWCWRRLARAGWVRRSVAERIADAHWQASIDQVTDGDYVATHWLVSFALLALGDVDGGLDG